jgi:hypothetical protein
LLQWYDDLPRDPVEAFIYLEELFRNRFLTEQKTMEGGTLDPKRGVTILKTEYAADYWQRRQKVIALASYIALKTKRT